MFILVGGATLLNLCTTSSIMEAEFIVLELAGHETK